MAAAAAHRDLLRLELTAAAGEAERAAPRPNGALPRQLTAIKE
jgi:hypothetical protein